MEEEQHVDVLIVGAGISGIGGAYHLSQQCPEKSFLILESQDDFGGTWRTHTYPGIRSDSDLYTFGYRFKPWTGPPIASAKQILSYVGEVIDENDLDQHIRYGQRVERAEWSSENRRWSLKVHNTKIGESQRYSAKFLWMCQGYYRHSEGYTPSWPGLDKFNGPVVHPQTWPDDLDYADKRVLVIGSGATAATIVPAIASKCEHVTMLQRSPTYFHPRPNSNEVADMLRELDIPEEWTHEIVRRKILHDQREVVQLSFDFPELVKEELVKAVTELLPSDYPVEDHFVPSYRPWQQRIAMVPDGDLFKGISSGDVSVVTAEIKTFTDKGILLDSGEELEADIIVTATGFELNVLGDIKFVVDGVSLDFANTITYRGMMFSGVPNMLWVFGYFRASWTLRADLLADFVCRLLIHMDELEATMVTPTLGDGDEGMKRLPWVDPEDFNPGYLRRGMHLLPGTGDRDPWRHSQDYWSERDLIPAIDLDEASLRYR